MARKRISKKRIEEVLTDIKAEINKAYIVWPAYTWGDSALDEFNRATARLITEPMFRITALLSNVRDATGVKEIITGIDGLILSMEKELAQKEDAGDVRYGFETALVKVRRAGLTSVRLLVSGLFLK